MAKNLTPNLPSVLLASLGGLLTANEELVIQAITAGTYFHFNETPTGTIDGANATFTLSSAPNPAASLEVNLNGQYLKGGGVDFTLSGTTLTMTVAPDVGSTLLVNYTVSPV